MAENDPPRRHDAQRDGDRSRDDGARQRNGRPGGDAPRPMGGGMGRWWFYLLLAALFFTLFNPFGDRRPEVPYTVFKQQIREDNVDRVVWQGSEIRGTFAETVVLSRETGRPLPAEEASVQDDRQDGAAPEGVEVDRFTTYVPAGGDPELLQLMNEADVLVETRPEPNNAWVTLLIGALPVLILVGLGIWFMRRMQGQGGPGGVFQVGQSKAQLYDTEDVDVTFDDVAGAEAGKRELQQTIAFLKDPESFLSLGGRTPAGVLLLGPPGTGKTLLARAVAGEAGVPFFSTSGSDFMEMFVGVGASRVRDMFEEAKKSAPAIIFIDELDSIGRQRGAGLGGGHDEREQTLNQLLKEMDGFEPNEKIVVMAATNRPDVLDPALLRPGRFDKRVTIDLPSKKARLEILRIHAESKPLTDDVDLEALARGTPGLSGADLENVLNEAALHAAREDKEVIDASDVDAARDKVLLGRQREGVALTDDERRLIAYHEGGHAVVAAALPHADPIEKVSIVPRGRSMGVTQQLPEREKYVYERDYLLDRLAVVMGGRAAEAVVLGTSTSGAAGDFQEATRLAGKMVREFGMSDALGPVSYKRHEGQVFLGDEIAQRSEASERTEREIDEEVRRLLTEAMERARETLESHRDALDEIARLLQDEEEVDGARATRIVRGEEAVDDDTSSSGDAGRVDAQQKEAVEETT